MKYNVLNVIKKCEYFVLNKEEKVPKLLSERDLIGHFLSDCFILAHGFPYKLNKF